MFKDCKSTKSIKTHHAKIALQYIMLFIILTCPAKADHRSINATYDANNAQYHYAFEYSFAVKRALRMYDYLKNSRFLKRVDADSSIKDFDVRAGIALTKWAELLLINDAPILEIEHPGMFALWAQTMEFMDKAEASGLYKPDATLQNWLNAWRIRREVHALIESAPWVNGPAQVTIDANVAPITIPVGYRFLNAEAWAVLYTQYTAIIKRHENMISMKKVFEPIHGQHWFMPTNGSWSASLKVLNLDRFSASIEMPDDNQELLETFRIRIDPVARLSNEGFDRYSRQAVRWLIPPEKDNSLDRIRWAMTDGSISQAINIIYVELILGNNQMIVFTLDNLRVAEILATSETLPEGIPSSYYSPEERLKQIRGEIETFLRPITFVAGHRLVEIAPGDQREKLKLEHIIAGPPTPLEMVVKRNDQMQQYKKDQFWNRIRNTGIITICSIIFIFIMAAITAEKPRKQ